MQNLLSLDRYDLLKNLGIGITGAALGAATGGNPLLIGPAASLATAVFQVAYPAFEKIHEFFEQHLNKHIANYISEVVLLNIPLAIAIGTLHAAGLCAITFTGAYATHALAMALLAPLVINVYDKITDADNLPLFTGSQAFIAGCFLGGNPIALGAAALVTSAIGVVVSNRFFPEQPTLALPNAIGIKFVRQLNVGPSTIGPRQNGPDDDLFYPNNNNSAQPEPSNVLGGLQATF